MFSNFHETYSVSSILKATYRRLVRLLTTVTSKRKLNTTDCEIIKLMFISVYNNTAN